MRRQGKYNDELIEWATDVYRVEEKILLQILFGIHTGKFRLDQLVASTSAKKRNWAIFFEPTFSARMCIAGSTLAFAVVVLAACHHHPFLQLLYYSCEAT